MLGFSEIFFSAFSIDSDRADQWQLMALLLRNEENGRILTSDLFDPNKNKDFLTFIDRGRNKIRDNTFKTLLSRFNSKGLLAELQAGKSKTRSIVLTEKFTELSSKYVELFVARMAKGKLTWHPSERTQVLLRMKIIIGFQLDRYYPAWKRCIERIAKAKVSATLSEGKIQSTLLRGAPCWPIILTAWRYQLGDRMVRVTSSGLFKEIFDSMRGADPKEIEYCLSFLFEREGPQVLVKTKVQGSDLYVINTERYGDIIADYADDLLRLNKEMLEIFTRK